MRAGSCSSTGSQVVKYVGRINYSTKVCCYVWQAATRDLGYVNSPEGVASSPAVMHEEQGRRGVAEGPESRDSQERGAGHPTKHEAAAAGSGECHLPDADSP